MSAPRVVVVTRPTELSELLAVHATRSQARFFLQSRGQKIGELEERHARQQRAVEVVQGSIPLRYRRAQVSRADLDRFLFSPEDIVVAVGQDGLVANVAKYLSRQPVIGINPGDYDGVLVQHKAEDVASRFRNIEDGNQKIELRTLACATLADGQTLCALNEIFIGHRSHQSARYRLCFAKEEERQSSSGVIVATGTGASGWAKSLATARAGAPVLPTPEQDRLAFMVREAWGSGATGTRVVNGVITRRDKLQLVSEMEDGVIFGDGVESDYLAFGFGQRATVRVAQKRLALVAA